MTLLERLKLADDTDTISFHHKDDEGKWSSDSHGYTVGELKRVIDGQREEDVPPDLNS